MARFSDLGLCLRCLEYSESSQIVTLLTRSHGKARGLAKGATRLAPSSTARFCGGVWPLQLGEATLLQRPGGDLDAVLEWDLLEDHHHLRSDLHAQHMSLAAAELVDAMLPEADPHPHVFDWLLELLSPRSHGSAMGLVPLLRFQWRLLDAAGYRPDLDNIGVAEPDEVLSFNPSTGTFSRSDGSPDWRTRGATLRVLRALSGERHATPGAVEAALAAPLAGDGLAHRRAARLLHSYSRTLADRALPAGAVALREPVGPKRS